MINSSTIFRNEAKCINEYFTKLDYSEDQSGLPVVEGQLELNDENGNLIDSYSISIKPSDVYPYGFPLVFEVGRRIPINIDWHVFPDGHCCIKTVPEEILLCQKGITLPWFIKEQVLPYFFNQKYREENGYFLNERSHGLLGTIEFFYDHFNTKDVNVVLNLLNESQKSIEGNSDSKCVCGSGKKYKKCHRRSIRTLSVFSEKSIKKLIYLISTRKNEIF